MCASRRFEAASRIPDLVGCRWCQLVLPDDAATGDLTTIDNFASWADVVQVRTTEDPAACPICLYPPSCPMSPVCGHAMCYACALRFADNCPGGDCPICHKPLILAEFRPLKYSPKPSYSVGDEVTFKLVSRRKSGRFVVPAGETPPPRSTIPKLSSPWSVNFSSVLSGDPGEILSEVYMAQEGELRAQLDGGDEELVPYVLRCLEQVEERKGGCYAKMESPYD